MITGASPWPHEYTTASTGSQKHKQSSPTFPLSPLHSPLRKSGHLNFHVKIISSQHSLTRSLAESHSNIQSPTLSSTIIPSHLLLLSCIINRLSVHLPMLAIKDQALVASPHIPVLRTLQWPRTPPLLITTFVHNARSYPLRFQWLGV